MKFLLGRKKNMTQIFDEAGTVFPVTVIQSGPLSVLQLKTKEKDGYDSIQVGFEEGVPKKGNKSLLGHTKGKTFSLLKEIKDYNKEGGKDVSLDSVIDVSTFEVGDKVSVSAVSKGKGFQGVVKRHGFHGGPRTHGNKHAERSPGSIGATGPQRVFKGTKMAGRMGTKRTTVKNLVVVGIDKDAGVLMIKGAIPGKPGTYVEIRG